MIIAHPGLSDSATLATAETVAASMPLTNLQSIQPTDAARFLSPGSAYFTVDFGAATTVDFCALGYTNATFAATWRVRAAATEAGLTGAPSYDSGSISLWPASGLGDWAYVHGLLDIGVDKTFRWWRIDIADAGNPAGYFQAGRLILANAWRPRGILNSEGAEFGWQDSSEWSQSRGGQTYVDGRPRARSFSFGLSNIDDTEMFPNAFWLDRTRGRVKDVIFSLDPAHATLAQDWTIIGLMSELSPARTLQKNRWAKRYQIEELL